MVIKTSDCVNDVVNKIEQLLGEKPSHTIDCCGYENTANIGLQVQQKFKLVFENSPNRDT